MPDLAFVIKRYGAGAVGGAETLVRQFSRQLSARGYTVEVLTTCMRDERPWQNAYPPGLCQVDGIPVRRFPIRAPGSARSYETLGQVIGNRLRHTPEQERQWWQAGLHSPALYSYLRQHGQEYRLAVIVDYSVGLSLYALAANPGRTAVYPLLHREPFAFLPSVRRWLNAAHGIIFNLEAEREFAQCDLGVTNPNIAIVGAGVEAGLIGQGARFRRKFGIHQPFLLYVGRLEAAKNVQALMSCFGQYKSGRDTPLNLVVLGTGSYPVPDHPDIVPLGYASEQDKFDAYAAALAVCQPSLLESLSIVVLEALGQGTPCLVHGANDVTRYHCLAGNCGLYFYACADFALGLDFLQAHPAACQQLGQNGRRYVLQNYTWPLATERLLEALKQFGW